MAMISFETQERPFSFMDDAKAAAVKENNGDLALTPDELITHWVGLEEAARRLGARRGAIRQ
ncbi:hypothetical protein KBD71_04920 [Candidatus Woesebacteria bacterium]|nr:hypothetical protein [Candidatus Woesebacteria bacterium]